MDNWLICIAKLLVGPGTVLAVKYLLGECWSQPRQAFWFPVPFRQFSHYQKFGGFDSSGTKQGQTTGFCQGIELIEQNKHGMWTKYLQSHSDKFIVLSDLPVYSNVK